MQDSGNALVSAPDGRRLWSTHTKGTPHAVFEMLDIERFGRHPGVVWSPQLPDPLHC
jgi:hypothetical protein